MHDTGGWHFCLLPTVNVTGHLSFGQALNARLHQHAVSGASYQHSPSLVPHPLYGRATFELGIVLLAIQRSGWGLQYMVRRHV